jgi:hypothetical protein
MEGSCGYQQQSYTLCATSDGSSRLIRDAAGLVGKFMVKERLDTSTRSWPRGRRQDTGQIGFDIVHSGQKAQPSTLPRNSGIVWVPQTVLCVVACLSAKRPSLECFTTTYTAGIGPIMKERAQRYIDRMNLPETQSCPINGWPFTR